MDVDTFVQTQFCVERAANLVHHTYPDVGYMKLTKSPWTLTETGTGLATELEFNPQNGCQTLYFSIGREKEFRSQWQAFLNAQSNPLFLHMTDLLPMSRMLDLKRSSQWSFTYDPGIIEFADKDLLALEFGETFEHVTHRGDYQSDFLTFVALVLPSYDAEALRDTTTFARDVKTEFIKRFPVYDAKTVLIKAPSRIPPLFVELEVDAVKETIEWESGGFASWFPNFTGDKTTLKDSGDNYYNPKALKTTSSPNVRRVLGAFRFYKKKDSDGRTLLTLKILPRFSKIKHETVSKSIVFENRSDEAIIVHVISETTMEYERYFFPNIQELWRVGVSLWGAYGSNFKTVSPKEYSNIVYSAFPVLIDSGADRYVDRHAAIVHNNKLVYGATLTRGVQDTTFLGSVKGKEIPPSSEQITAASQYTKTGFPSDIFTLLFAAWAAKNMVYSIQADQSVPVYVLMTTKQNIQVTPIKESLSLKYTSFNQVPFYDFVSIASRRNRVVEFTRNKFHCFLPFLNNITGLPFERMFATQANDVITIDEGLAGNVYQLNAGARRNVIPDGDVLKIRNVSVAYKYGEMTSFQGENWNLCSKAFRTDVSPYCSDPYMCTNIVRLKNLEDTFKQTKYGFACHNVWPYVDFACDTNAVAAVLITNVVNQKRVALLRTNVERNWTVYAPNKTVSPKMYPLVTKDNVNAVAEDILVALETDHKVHKESGGFMATFILYEQWRQGVLSKKTWNEIMRSREFLNKYYFDKSNKTWNEIMLSREFFHNDYYEKWDDTTTRDNRHYFGTDWNKDREYTNYQCPVINGSGEVIKGVLSKQERTSIPRSYRDDLGLSKKKPAGGRLPKTWVCWYCGTDVFAQERQANGRTNKGRTGFDVSSLKIGEAHKVSLEFSDTSEDELETDYTNSSDNEFSD